MQVWLLKENVLECKWKWKSISKLKHSEAAFAKEIMIIEWNRIEIEIEGDDAMGMDMIECAWSSKAIAWIQFYS